MPKILLIEDDESLRENLAEALEFEGFEVQVATGGREGLELVRRITPDLIVCDVLMPGITGLNVVQEIRAMPGAIAKTPIILFSALAHRKDIQVGLAVGATLYLTKPCSLSELIGKMRSLLP